MAVVIITVAKEEVRRSRIKREKSIEEGGQGWKVQLNKHRTSVQETYNTVNLHPLYKRPIILTQATKFP